MWSQVIDTPLGQAARRVYEGDPARHYHNWDHVLRLYWHAEHTFDLAYDADLDRAILTHDVVYDALPDKEKRSAEWLAEKSDRDETVAMRHIMKTTTHAPTDDNRMVLLDLADFMDSRRNDCNFENIRLESRALYGVTDAQFLDANIAFVSDMIERIKTGLDGVADLADRTHFEEIIAGMQRGLTVAKARRQAL